MDHMDTDETLLTEEVLLRKHRQERKDLQAKIQSLKKSAPKGDKRKKKEIMDSITKLEDDLDHKQNLELQNLNECSRNIMDKLTENTDGMDVEDDEMEKQEATKITRAQKRRNRKIEDEREREKRISDQEEANKQGPRVLEMNSIKEILKENNLDIYNIPADGNCLYCAVNHQLEKNGKETFNVSKLRKMTAEFIRQNKEDFLPFMYNDTEEVVDDKLFENYCKEVAYTKLWGGQLELKALSNILKCPIKIIQASGPLMVQGENFDGPPLVLTYHRHLYRLGEHYNSTTETVKNENDEKQ